MTTNLSPIVARAANKHSSAEVGDKLAASWTLSNDAGNTARAGTDGAVFVPATPPGTLPSIIANGSGYNFSTETGWVFRTNPVNTTYNLAPPAGMPLGSELRIINRSGATITLAGATVRGLNNVAITTIPPNSSLWFYRDNGGTYTRTI